jgi:predicted CXXCH cytochrome family protein
MKIWPSTFFGICLLVFPLLLASNGFAQMVDKNSCLNCHGPFDKLVSAKPAFKAESKETINPHVYVPHDKKEPKNTPDCTNCHSLHSMDTKSAAMKNIPKADVKWCYSCHHTNNFESCKKCHQN